jgi:hypothetical protein
MNNAIFWDLKTPFLPHKKHNTSLLQSPAGYCYVRFDVLAAVTTKNALFWVLTPRDSRKNRRFRKRITKVMEAIRSSETSVLTRATLPNITEDDFLHIKNVFTACFDLHWQTSGV